ncbi:GlxA family transcriptional regulator [Brucella grignonensis]|uniref:GlxA family transcriptional regulator n=1 Tax=Brucella grignonensis TaxID=94627 RepID=UPI0035BC68F3
MLTDTLPLRVGFLLTHNFTFTALAGFLDVLRLSADDGDASRPIKCQWHIMSMTGEPIRSSCGTSVNPSCGFVDPEKLDHVVVVGGLLHSGPNIHGAAGQYLCDCARAGKKLIGVCTGSFVLCRLGLLGSRKCCISWFHYRDFIEEFADSVPIADRLYVVDGDCITCSGGVGVTYLAASLVERHLGPATALKALHILQVGRLLPGSTRQPAPPFDLASDNERVSSALLIMEQNLGAPLPIAKIARRIAVSERQLERLFNAEVGSGPSATYLQLRLKHGRWMLRSDRSIATIAADTGFSDAAHFSKTFKKFYGVNPSEQRRLEQDHLVSTVHAFADDCTRRVFD